jgi:hypothetical protein
MELRVTRTGSADLMHLAHEGRPFLDVGESLQRHACAPLETTTARSPERV